MNIYKSLIQYIKYVPIFDTVWSSEVLRMAPIKQAEIHLIEMWPAGTLMRRDTHREAMNDWGYHPFHSLLTTYNVLLHVREDASLVCHFPPKDHPLGLQWVGITVPQQGLFTLTYSLRFLKLDDPSILLDEKIGLKIHGPHRVQNKWLTPTRSLGEWYDITVEGLVSHINNPIILLFLDYCINQTVIIAEIKDIRLI